jgi:hypothetical protein
VDQKIGAGRELVARAPFRLQPAAVLKAERGLVIGQVDGDPALLLDPETGQIAQMHREQGRGEIARQTGESAAGRPADLQLPFNFSCLSSNSPRVLQISTRTSFRLQQPNRA